MNDPGASSSASLAPASGLHSGSNTSQPRSTWTEAETWVLIRLWEDHLPQLRGEEHNAKVYDAIVAALAQSGIKRTRRQVQTKIDNLTQRYTKESRERTTGSSPSPWPFYSEVHRILGAVPANDRSLIQESPCSRDETVEMIISSMERSNGNTSGEEVADAVENASDSQGPASTTQQRLPQKRKRQSATENFRNNLLEQQNKLIATLQEATKVDQALRERQVNAQEKLADLLSQYFNK
ncbi:hypothetical protein HPB49_009896 [Dermacentor silvarum]|uniref:Uncharacterized protein n=1 Tax=Dermacentor silvarum TaxID=543639 RepID=A0ACB8DC12_DERSI|nr:myb/SANT-like DNA-binding domain-containing protein 1 [Dermacentor silvarum]KAH7965702.1 hypothetical protein HPB49_009896 [Dermacentor silvarum]